MKAKVIVTVLLLILSVSASANMRYNDPGWSSDLGLTGYYYRYNERSSKDNKFFMCDKGPMYGFYYNFGYQCDCLVRIAMEGYYTWTNNIHYKSRGTGRQKNVKYTSAELRFLGSYPWALNCGWTVEGYTGLAARSVFNPGYNTFTTTGAMGYDRHSSYDYIPIGTRFIKPFACDTHFIAHVEYDWFLSGTQTSYFDGVLKNAQHKGFGLRTGVDFYIPSRFEYFDYLVGTFVRYWKIGNSTVNTSSRGHFRGLEPKNTTVEVGIRLGLVF